MGKAKPKQARPPWQWPNYTKPLAEIICKDCRRPGCLIPVPHAPAATLAEGTGEPGKRPVLPYD